MKKKAIEVVMDSVTLNSALKSPNQKSTGARQKPINPLDKPISDRTLRLAVDAQNGLRSEWERTCGISAVHAFVVHCEQYDGIQLIKTPQKPGSTLSKKLSLLGFGNNAIDKLILKIALATEDRIIVSSDSDFWDPTKPNDRKSKGNKNAPVARFCRDKLGVTILLLKMLLAKFD